MILLSEQLYVESQRSVGVDYSDRFQLLEITNLRLGIILE